MWENCRGPESGPEHGGIGSVIELATAKQVYKKVHFTTRLVGILQLVTRSTSICCLWGLVVPLFCSLMPKVKILNFWSEIVKRLLGATHVFRRNFTFCNFVFIGGALNLLRHVVDLSLSLTMSRPAETTEVDLPYKTSWSCSDIIHRA